MKINGYEFEHICDIKPARSTDESFRDFMPQDRYQNSKNLPLNKYGAGPFCKFKIPSRFRIAGVYVVTIDDEVRYVGECKNLSARYNAGYGNISPKNCFRGGQETNCRLNNLFLLREAQGGKRISLRFFRTAQHKAIEAALRSGLNAIWNRV
jgi:hypothetical protein